MQKYPTGSPGSVRPGGGGGDKRMASWALGLSFVPCLISLVVALVLALIVLFRRDDGVDHGERRAAAALCVLFVWTLITIGALAVTLAQRAPRDDTGEVTAGGSSPVLDLQVGDCVEEELGEGETYAVDVIPCAEPHAAEVYATFDLEGEWTSRAEVDEATEAGCLQRFEPYVGERVRRSELAVYFYQPQDAASFRADPAVICLAQSPSPATGSVRGSGKEPASPPADPA